MWGAGRERAERALLGVVNMRCRKLLLGCTAAFGLLTASACTDLDVANPNEPDTDKVLRTPGDIESLIASSFHTWWHANNNRYPTMALATMANQHSSRWADWGMQDLAAEPRVPRSEEHTSE